MQVNMHGSYGSKVMLKVLLFIPNCLLTTHYLRIYVYTATYLRIYVHQLTLLKLTK